MNTTQSEFVKIIKRLELSTEGLGKDRGELYYERLKGYDFNTLWKAVTILLDNYKYKRFPSIAEIRDACKDADSRIAWAIAKEHAELEGNHECEKCQGMGWVTVEYFEPLYQAMHEMVVNCTCRIGRDRMETWKKDPDPNSPVKGDWIYERAGDE